MVKVKEGECKTEELEDQGSNNKDVHAEELGSCWRRGEMLDGTGLVVRKAGAISPPLRRGLRKVKRYICKTCN